MKSISSLFMLLLATTYAHCTIDFTSAAQTDTGSELCIKAHIDNDMLYQEYLNFSINDPRVSISSWKADVAAHPNFDTTFKEKKSVYDTDTTFRLLASGDISPDSIVTVTYMSAQTKTLAQKSIHLSSLEKQATLETLIETETEVVATQESVTEKSSCAVSPNETKTNSWSDKISAAIVTTDSLLVKILLVILLGIFMSLTPCIYPMIPITAGILQSQGSTSFLRNFFLALCYTLGMALTFAALGLSAAYTGKVFGSLMANPIIILLIVALLVYLAFSMMGVYEMYIPRIMQPKHLSGKKGSALSAFIFGAASGTFASPCLSPGLVLLLSIVTSLQNGFLGFVLLFAFGVGVSIPLLIIGTFSGALNMLPRAGMWMVEIKRIFGFIMLCMAVYFLKPLAPDYILSWILTAVIASCALYYLYRSSKQPNTFNTVAAIIALTLACVNGFRSYDQTKNLGCHDTTLWMHSYQDALDLALKDGKKLFVDVGAPYCSVCKAIDQTLLSDEHVIKTLCTYYVCVKLDGSLECNESFNAFYNIKGFPALFVIDPASHAALLRWGSELYKCNKDAFIKKLIAAA